MQARFYHLLDLPFRLSLDTQAVSDVVKNRFGKRIGTLKHHADTLAQKYHICRLVIDILCIEFRLSLGTSSGDEVIHAIERAQKGRFAATGWPNQGGNLMFAYGQRDIIEGLFGTVVKIQMLNIYFYVSLQVEIFSWVHFTIYLFPKHDRRFIGRAIDNPGLIDLRLLRSIKTGLHCTSLKDIPVA